MHPLNKILSSIPDTDYVRNNLLSYADHQVSEASANVTRLARDFNPDNALNYFNVLPFSSMLQRFFPEGNLPEEAGFHFFDVDQTASYGFLQNSGAILLGAFDVEEIADALSLRTYEIQSESNMLLLQSQKNLTPSPENPLRHDTVMTQPQMLHSLSSSVYRDYQSNHSLFETPIYKSAASALIASGSVRQAQFIPASRTHHRLLSGIGSETETQQRKHRLQTYNQLPAYRLTVMGDVVRDGRQYIQHVLVYDDIHLAQKAADELHQRTKHYYRMPEFINRYSSSLGIRDTSVWGDITLGVPRIHQSELPCVMLALERELPVSGTDFDKSRIDNLFRLVVERIHNMQADYLTVMHAIME